jgi:teichuronic acid biosynthesis glycosyltransferase TuaG|tara:strand:+ start:93 stop:740 length:648 start_codon:yes stop_codon:yes gene_type:complete
MISILLPIYNGIEFLPETLNSIISQSYKNWELIIGVNGYDKNSSVYKIAKENEKRDKRIKVYDLYTIKGKSEALNKMLFFSNYKWISLIDVDDIWYPTKLKNQIKFTEKYDVIGTNCKYFGDLNTYPNIPLEDLSDYNFLYGNPIINSSSLIKKELCFWKVNYDGIEDYELWLRLWRQGKKFYNIKTFEVLHRIHKKSAFNSKGQNINDLLNEYK